MRAFLAVFTALFLLGCSNANSQDSESASLEEIPREEIEGIVRDYILQNPEIIEEALIELQRRAGERQESLLLANVNANSEALYNDERDPLAGADQPVIEIVEFFDYRCPYCKATAEWVEATLNSERERVRFIFKEFPVLGPQSLEAAQASYAVWIGQSEHYEDYHNLMMSYEDPLPSEQIDALAASIGIDVAQMRQDMERDEVFDYLGDVRALAQSIGITGTPFYVVGETVIPGADLMALETALEDALAN